VIDLAGFVDDLRTLQRIVERESGTKLDIVATIDPSLYVDVAHHYPEAGEGPTRTPNGIARMELGERCQLTVVARAPASMVDDVSRSPAVDDCDELVEMIGRLRTWYAQSRDRDADQTVDAIHFDHRGTVITTCGYNTGAR
jgi:hypothetical protein